MQINSFNDLKFTLKHIKRSYMFRSYDCPQGEYIDPCQSYSLKTLSDLHRYVELVLWQHVLCIVWVGAVAACVVYCVSWCCGSMSCVLCELVLWQYVLCIVWVGAVAACLVYCVSWCCGSMCCVLCELVLWQHVLCIVLVGAVAACLVYCVSWCCGSMSCVLCESYTVRNEPDGRNTSAYWRSLVASSKLNVSNDCSESLTFFAWCPRTWSLTHFVNAIVCCEASSEWTAPVLSPLFLATRRKIMA